MLTFTFAPASVTWAEEPDTTIDTQQDAGDANSSGNGAGGAATEAPADGAENADDAEDDGAGEDGDSSGADGQGVQPLADSEDLPSLGLQVRIASDGTESWDADDNAGNDSGPNNGIVRVNDTVTYEVEYVVTNNDAANLTWSLTFPKGMEITQIPGYCQASGSSLVPATAGTPAIPLTANSINELSEQTLTCNMGNRSVATDKVFVTTKVLNVAHQAQDLPLTVATVTADGVEAPISATLPLPSVKASARLMWDISKNAISLTENSGIYHGPINVSCPQDPARICKRTMYPILVSAPSGGKGAMPAVGDVTFVDDFSPEAMYPGLTSAQHAAMNADLAKYGTYVEANAGDWSVVPMQAIGSSGGTATNSVRNSGTWSRTQAGGPGTPAQFTIGSADWSLRTYPSMTASGSTLPANSAYAVSRLLVAYTPVDTIRDFGIESPAGSGIKTLPTLNVLSEFSARGFNPQTDTQNSAQQPGPNAQNLPAGASGPVHWNDYRTTTPRIEPPGPFTKRFVAAPGEPNNMTVSEFGNSGVQGPPGGATYNSGGITVAPTQNVASMIISGGSSADNPMPIASVVCDAWDNSRLHLRAADYPSLPAAYQSVGSEGVTPVWVSGYTNVPTANAASARMATSKAEVPTIRVQYSGSTVGGPGASSDCGASKGTWYDSPSEVPGNDPALASNGVFTAVNRVRVHMVIPEPVAPTQGNSGSVVYAAISIGMQVADSGLPTGSTIPNWGSRKIIADSEATMDEVVGGPGNWSLSNYNPGVDRNDAAGHTGTTGDRLILAHAQARIDKQVRKGDSGAFSSTPPQVTGGDLVQYQLSPSLTSGAMTPGILKDVWVEDCLPASQSYETASITPAVVTPGSTPADAKRPACATGETYIRWVLPDHEVNTPIDPIILSVEVSPTAADGVYTNTVVVWAEDDASTLAQRRDQAQIQIANIAGIKLEKVALTPVVQVNRSGQGTNELNKWAVRLTNTLPASEQSGVSNPDVIDVLPKQGTAGTSFNGTFQFVEAAVTQGGAQTRILYTKTANVSANPNDPSNGAAGATTWCDAPAGGTRVSGANGCPASAGEVTGLRIQRSGAYLSGDVIEIELSMVGIGNHGGDVYVNRAMAAATGLDNTVGPIRRQEVAIESSIGDYTWWDLNRDGVQNQFKGADEQPATGILVRVTGTDDLGNPVEIDTTTGTDGKYVFEQLRSSNADGYTVTFTKPDGSEFTVKTAGNDRAVDSNADPATGASDPVVLGRDTHDLTIDAGLTPLGGVQISKALTGAGAGEFAADDVLTFQVVCTFDPELTDVEPTEVLNQAVSLPVNGATAILSEVMGGLPAFSSCTITETGHGSADAPAAPVTVTVPWDAVEEQSGTVTGSLTNFISAGSVQVSKTLAGDDIAVEAAKDRMFEILTTCQIEEEGEDGETVISDVYSGVVKIKGGQTKYLVGDDGEPRLLPLNARCFGEEVNTGGAAASTVDFDSWENSVPVTSGTPEELQVLTISAVNTFENAELTVSKKVEGPGTGGAYDFTLSCTIPGVGENGEVVDGEYVLPDTDAEFRLKDGESRTIQVPAGVSCQVKETNVPDGAKVTITDSDKSTDGGASDGIVANLTGTDNTVKVLNTFPERPPLVVTGGQMLGAACLLGTGLLLVGGALFLLRRRRTAHADTPAQG